MAPPSANRSGSNKRAQLGLFAGYLAAGLGMALGILLLAISLWRPETFNGLRSMASDAAAPVGEVGAAGRVGSRNFFEAIAGYYDAGSKNAELEEEIKIARVKLAEARALAQENERLKAVLSLSDGDVSPITTARLIGSTSTSTRRFAYLSAGRREGVEPGMPVTSPLGLVGRVLEAGANTSRVLLLTDTDSVVPVRRATDNTVAFAEGRADGSLRIRLINLGINPLKVGDIFVTSGAGGMFHPGTAVAMVSEITDDGAIGQLLSNPAATDVVIVKPVWQGELIDTMGDPLANDSEGAPEPEAEPDQAEE
ncbi:rod shape-determining protein MreC [Aurantiacibacter rhizosphaerae]|uniref:Cell shape-determining protein MreC n=1 Tax=Aurantiacibacter rhizosphaerae TaxID=2691582 RepID=A0A844XEQ5_9SPHN|nr:rod shape-determining protein MreC [Aurantiacibacter rhizosphaerae]MWV28058.1 rod shape-determining protein MreC [Aurantiacibacter rhizosphaerae]